MCALGSVADLSSSSFFLFFVTFLFASLLELSMLHASFRSLFSVMDVVCCSLLKFVQVLYGSMTVG
jgi:hypothetical protein